jgi:hypothetical protein
MMIRKLILSVALAALACGSFAQQIQIQGGPGGFRGGMMMGGPGGNPTMLLVREDVQTDLGLTDDQKSKLKSVGDSIREKMQGAMAQAAGDREAMGKIFREVQEQATKDTNAILTPDQQKRLKEISLQMAGSRAAMRPDVQKDLGLTEDQKSKLKVLGEKMQEASRAVMEKARSGEIQWTDVRATMEKNNTIMDGEIEKVLTSAQKDKLKAMGGKPFARKDPPQGQGGFRFGGGGR